MSATSPLSTEHRLRRDAERNRRLILDAAREAFASSGLHVTLDEIARRAGVGVGTVYRRFADKESLIDALFEDSIAELVALAERASREEDPWGGFVRFFKGFVALQAENRGLKEVVLSGRHCHARMAAARQRLSPLLSQLVKRAQTAGELRSDLRPGDVGLLAEMITSVADTTRQISPDLYRRYMTIVLDGLRAGREHPSRLPTRALSLEETEAIHRPERH